MKSILAQITALGASEYFWRDLRIHDPIPLVKGDMSGPVYTLGLKGSGLLPELFLTQLGFSIFIEKASLLIKGQLSAQ